MITSFIIHFREMYPEAQLAHRLPKDVSHRLAYAKAITWYKKDSWLSIQHCNTKHIYLYYLEVNTPIPLYLPVEVTFADIHWQFALRGGYELYENGLSNSILLEGFHHRIYAEPHRFVTEVGIGRHIIIGFNIAKSWLKRYSDTLHIHTQHMGITLVPEKLYQEKPGQIDDFMLAELYILMQLPDAPHLMLDSRIYMSIARLVALEIEQRERTLLSTSDPMLMKIRAIHTYVDQLILNHQPIPLLTEVALRFNIDFNQLYRAHKRLMGFHLNEYVNSKKLEHSVALLQEGRQTSEITFLLNYSDVSSFSRAFKTKYGLSPTQYIALFN